ncbi:MAG: A/G-specific adenine glycosylase [Fretibacterium sp.]|nr:A/G-specific adenine glycosylase [Fretibacterium sp.]
MIPWLLVEWFRAHARALPWRDGYDPYKILVSEFMLQQTQVGTVIPYFERWIIRWPDLRSLAAADETEALKLWEGLGYYSRCRNLLKAARAMAEAGYTSPPAPAEELRTFPGIGAYTAGAIASIGYNLPVPAVDGNVERVISRLLGIEEPSGSAALRHRVTEAVSSMLNDRNNRSRKRISPREFNQALMDLGAMVCTPSRGGVPFCGECPWENYCLARKTGREAELPLPRQRAPISRDEAWGVLAVSSIHKGILLHRRPNKGLWAAMWEIPWFLRSGNFWEDFDAWCVSCGLNLSPDRNSPKEVGYTSFSFTTHHVRAQVVTCSVEGTLPDETWRFFSLRELDDVSLPAPSRKFLACFEKIDIL